MRNFLKTPGLDSNFLVFGLAKVIQDDPKCMPKPGDPDWVDPNTLPMNEVRDLVRELMQNEGHGNPDWFRSEKYDYDLDNRDWEVLFARLGMKLSFASNDP